VCPPELPEQKQRSFRQGHISFFGALAQNPHRPSLEIAAPAAHPRQGVTTWLCAKRAIVRRGTLAAHTVI
jgi:hypothetical protein